MIVSAGLGRLLLATGLACAVSAGASASVPCRERKPDAWDITIAGPKEPGEILVVDGAVYSTEGKPMSGVTVYVYHADARGVYGAGPEGRANPRLCGVMLTGERGQYRFRTTMPGGYAGRRPHIHFEVWGRGIAQQAQLLQLGRELPRGGRTEYFTRALDTIGADRFAVERPLTRDSEGVLHCVRDLRVSVR